MEIFVIPAELKSFIDSYDKINYQLWNDEGNKDVKKFRSLIRNHYLSEQKLTCFYCKQYIFSTNGLHWQVEHILPKSLFPQFLFEPKNLIVICPDCNREKGDQNPHVNGNTACSQSTYPSTRGRFKIIHPFFDNYEEHIKRTRSNHCDYPDHYFFEACGPKAKATFRIFDLDRFNRNFAGFPDMSGKQVQTIDDLIELDLSTATFEQKQEAILRITQSMRR